MSEATLAATGAVSSIAVGDESTFGTPVDPTHEVSGFTSESLASEEDTLTSSAIKGDRGVHDILEGQESASGDISFEVSAEGLGKIFYQCMGDYVKAPNVDGGAHGRQEEPNVQTTPESVSGGSKFGSGGTVRNILPMSKEQVTGFSPGGNVAAGGSNAGDGFAVVDRGGQDESLVFNDDGGAGYDFTEYAESSITFVDDSGAETIDTNLDGVESGDTLGGTDPLAFVVLSSVFTPEGYERPSVPRHGGYLELGPDREKYRVYHTGDTTDSDGNPAVKCYIDPNDKDGTSTSADWANGWFCFSHACLVYDTGNTNWNTSWPNTNSALPTGKGKFVYEYDSNNWSDVYTHHIERGRKLPTGLTIEVDRDASMFLYSGMKGTTLSFTFDSNSIATGTSSFAGRAEYAMATLKEDLLPDDKNSNNNSLVKGVQAFPDPAKFKAVQEDSDAESTASDIVDDSESFGSTNGHTVEVGDYVAVLESGEIAEITNIASTTNGTDNVLETNNSNLDPDQDENVRYVVFENNSLPQINIGERTSISYMSIIEEGDQQETDSNNYDANKEPIPDGQHVLGGLQSVEKFHPNGTNVDPRTSRKVVNPVSSDLRPLTSFEASVNLNGWFEEVLSGDVSIENGLNEDKFVLGSRFRQAMPAETAEVTGTLSMEFDDNKNYIKFKNSELFALEFRLIQEQSGGGLGDSTIGSTNIPPQMYLLLPKCKYTGDTPNVDGDSFIEHDMPFQAQIDDEYNLKTEVIMILTNGETQDVQL